VDPLTQATLGSALSQAASDAGRVRAFTLAGAVGGVAPDLDVLIRSASDPLVYLEFHRQFTHSLAFVPVGAAVCALVMAPLLSRWLRPMETYLACLLGYATHGLLDAATSYGTQLLWPFSDARVSWNWISVVDPLFTLPLLGLVVLGAVRRRRSYALLGLAWGLAYIGVGALQHERALALAARLAEERGQTADRQSVKPAFANLLLWKSVYAHDGRYHVDGLRLGTRPQVCDGESVASLDPSGQLPWLDEASQQWRDVARFAWFSDGWLALDREDPLYVVDIRYSSLPNRIDALWGLKLNPLAGASAHAHYHVVRARRTSSLTGLLDLARGDGCRELGLRRASMD
jgi:inner membrane protein